MARIQTYREFWPHYLEEHRNPWTRRLHVIGTVAGIGVGWGLASQKGPVWILAGFIVAYVILWASHFLIEKNKPASFDYPLWSFFSDFRMIFLILTGKLK